MWCSWRKDEGGSDDGGYAGGFAVEESCSFELAPGAIQFSRDNATPKFLDVYHNACIVSGAAIARQHASIGYQNGRQGAGQSTHPLACRLFMDEMLIPPRMASAPSSTPANHSASTTATGGVRREA
jgi:hypothetical protein